MKIKVTNGKHLVAVYGTLKYGYHNHRNYMRRASYKGDAVIRDVAIVNTMGFPYATRIEGAEATVELYEVTDSELRMVDGLEGHPTWYTRELVPTSHGMAWIYLQPLDSMVENIKRYGITKNWNR